MNTPSFRFARLTAGLAALSVCISAIAAPDPALTAAVAEPARSANFVARDKARHPVEELTFFAITPKMTVVELWPGGGYWSEILGPYLAKGGTYYVAQPAPGNAEEDKTVEHWRTRVVAQKDRLGTI